MEVAAERLHDLRGLVLAQQAVVDEDARELVADRLVHEQRGDRRVDAAGERAEHALAADLRADPLDLLLDHGGRRPRRAARRRRRRGSSSAPRCRAACARPRGGTGRRRGFRSGSSKAAIGVEGEPATTRAPSGGAVTESRWDIHTVCSSGRPREEPPALAPRARVLPNSETPVRSTAPPRSAPSTACRNRSPASGCRARTAGVEPRRAFRVHRGRAAAKDQRERVPRAHRSGRDVVRRRAPSRRGTRGPGARSAASTGRRGR